VPTIQANGIEIYFEEHGSGEPMLLIMGWGGNAATWLPQLPGLAARYRTIAFDNRGAGRSSAPDEPYSIPQMAADAVALLDALDVPQAHIFGISMGGMIAQELALRHSERVGALVLGCTSPGSSRAAGYAQLQSDIVTFQRTASQDGPDLEWFSDFLKRLWTDDALARSTRQLQDFVLSLIRHPPPPHGLRNQSVAISEHNAIDRLHEVGQPTLVITGSEDPLIDPGNSEILAERIPESELRIFAGLKHAFHLERPDLVNSVIVDFIERMEREERVETLAAHRRARRGSF
jgi:pimeloyl-ACP methyl ester carboxylesterase